MRVLFVDDDAAQRRLFVEMFRDTDIEATAVDPATAQSCDWAAYDMVLVDLLMAPQDGDDLARCKMPRVGAPQLAIMSAIPLDYIERTAQRMRADGYPCAAISKTIPQRFSQDVRSLLRC